MKSIPNVGFSPFEYVNSRLPVPSIFGLTADSAYDIYVETQVGDAFVRTLVIPVDVHFKDQQGMMGSDLVAFHRSAVSPEEVQENLDNHIDAVLLQISIQEELARQEENSEVLEVG